MKKSRTIGWVLLIAVLGGAGYFGWQRFHREDRRAEAENAQKAARPGPPFP